MGIDFSEVLSMDRKWIVVYGLTAAMILSIILGGKRAAQTFSEERGAQWCIVLDAGHGGEDGGATSCTGVLESGINLEITLRLRDLLHMLGRETRMIRTSDISVYTKGGSIAQKKMSDLKERVRIVNTTPNAMLLSIHQNNFSDSRYSGAQVFYADTQGSERLAKALQCALISSLNKGSNRKCKKSDGVYLMEHISCPGILVECGFLSNPAEEARLRSPDYQRKLCCVIATTVSSFLSGT